MCISLGNEKLLGYYFILTKSRTKIQEQKSCDLKNNNQGLNLKNVGRKLDIQLNFLTIICIPKSLGSNNIGAYPKIQPPNFN